MEIIIKWYQRRTYPNDFLKEDLRTKPITKY